LSSVVAFFGGFFYFPEFFDWMAEKSGILFNLVQHLASLFVEMA